MNLLIIPMSTAKHLYNVWINVNTSIDLLGILCILLAVITTLGAVILVLSHIDARDTQSEPKNARDVLQIMGTTILALIFFFGVGLSVYNRNVKVNEVGASMNIGCIHRMRHLQAIYPKLPCHQPKEHICTSKSLKNTYNRQRNTKKVLTRTRALKKYKAYKNVYRKNGYYTNESKSIHPTMPKWYNYL